MTTQTDISSGLEVHDIKSSTCYVQVFSHEQLILVIKMCIGSMS